MENNTRDKQRSTSTLYSSLNEGLYVKRYQPESHQGISDISHNFLQEVEDIAHYNTVRNYQLQYKVFKKLYFKGRFNRKGMFAVQIPDRSQIREYLLGKKIGRTIVLILAHIISNHQFIDCIQPQGASMANESAFGFSKC